MIKKIKRKIQTIKRGIKLTQAKKDRVTIDKLSTFIKQWEVDKVVDLLKKKVTAKNTKEKEELTKEIDLIAGAYTLKYIGVIPKEKPSDFLKKFADVTRRSRIAEQFGNKNDPETSRLHFEAEAALGDPTKYFDFVLLFPTMRTVLLRRAQKDMAKKRWKQNELF